LNVAIVILAEASFAHAPPTNVALFLLPVTASPSPHRGTVRFRVVQYLKEYYACKALTQRVAVLMLDDSLIFVPISLSYG